MANGAGKNRPLWPDLLIVHACHRDVPMSRDQQLKLCDYMMKSDGCICLRIKGNQCFDNIINST